MRYETIKPLKDTDFKRLKGRWKRFCRVPLSLGRYGYQGLAELHENSQAPFKKLNYHALPKQEAEESRFGSKTDFD